MRTATKRSDRPLVRPVVWIASSKDDLSTLPREVKGPFGFRLHAFMKTSKSGICLPKQDAELIAVRLRRARELDIED
jgi:phage-related protein